MDIRLSDQSKANAFIANNQDVVAIAPRILEAVIHGWLEISVAHRLPAEYERTDRSGQVLEGTAVRETIPATLLYNVDSGTGIVVKQPDDVAASVEG